MLYLTFNNLIHKFSNKDFIGDELWIELQNCYSAENRYYHNLSHLENMYSILFEVKDKIEHWDVILFSLFYHDIVYNVLRNDNEAQSAKLAEKRMTSLNVPKKMIESTKSHILATKNHIAINKKDTNYFLDADLSILGSSQEKYFEYAENIRKEYSVFSNLIYNSGRIKVLNNFLNMPRIYKTDYFFNKFEISARENMKNELLLLK